MYITDLFNIFFQSEIKYWRETYYIPLGLLNVSFDVALFVLFRLSAFLVSEFLTGFSFD